MLGPYDNYVYVNNPHDQGDNGMALATGWGLSNNGDIMQDNNPQNGNPVCYGDPCHSVFPNSELYNTLYEWDIKDSVLPRMEFHDKFEIWPNGDCRFIYAADNVKARKHKCGWSMRNTNNHNKMILKKSCLGIIKCSKDCFYPDENNRLSLAPKISEGARRCQLNNKLCPNRNCEGVLVQQPCRGKSGNPVTHYWRYNQFTNSIYFMAKGIHDHSKPKNLSKVTDRKVKSVKRDPDGRDQLQNSLEERPTFKTEIINMNDWNGNLVDIPSDCGNHSFIINQDLSFGVDFVPDLGQLGVERSSQAYHSNMSFMKTGYTQNENLDSSEENQLIASAKCSQSYISDCIENGYCSFEENPYYFITLNGQFRQLPENTKYIHPGEHQWAVDYPNGDALQQSDMNYTNIRNDKASDKEFLLNEDMKRFSFYKQ